MFRDRQPKRQHEHGNDFINTTHGGDLYLLIEQSQRLGITGSVIPSGAQNIAQVSNLGSPISNRQNITTSTSTIFDATQTGSAAKQRMGNLRYECG